jgi:hypothetical protein
MSAEDRIALYQKGPEGFAKRTQSYTNHKKRIMNMRIRQEQLRSNLVL